MGRELINYNRMRDQRISMENKNTNPDRPIRSHEGFNTNLTVCDELETIEHKRVKVVNCHKLNLRQSPSKDSKVLAILNPEDLLVVLEIRDDNWVHVCIEVDKGVSGVTGYVQSTYIDI